MNNLQMDYVEEHWQSYVEIGGFKMAYDVEKQYDAFKEKVNTFLEEHEIYDSQFMASTDEYGRTRYAAFFLYKEPETD